MKRLTNFKYDRSLSLRCKWQQAFRTDWYAFKKAPEAGLSRGFHGFLRWEMRVVMLSSVYCLQHSSLLRLLSFGSIARSGRLGFRRLKPRSHPCLLRTVQDIESQNTPPMLRRYCV